MEDIIDLIATNSSASEISTRIKEVLYTKAADRVDSARPIVASSLFGGEGEEGTAGDEE